MASENVSMTLMWVIADFPLPIFLRNRLGAASADPRRPSPLSRTKCVLKLASVLQLWGMERAMVVHGCGMDEIANIGETAVTELKDGGIKSYSIKPQDLGYPMAELADVAGGTPEDNARRLVSVLKGERSPARDIIAMNAGAAVYISGQVESLKEGAIVAEEAISSGKALDLLHKMVQMNGDYGKLVRFL